MRQCTPRSPPRASLTAALLSPGTAKAWESSGCRAPHVYVERALDARGGLAAGVLHAKGQPLPEATYYDAVVIRAADYCATCDYTGPLPDLEPVSAVSETRWGTLKALYR